MGALSGASIALIAASAISAAGTATAAGMSAKEKRKARKFAKTTQGKIEALERDRQDVINPYDRMTNLGAMIANPMAQLNVATEAAKFQAEEQDISLANTLDQMRAFGMGGGGATALAQGALMGKRGISANIQQQESRNAILRAQGEQSAMTMRMNEARRMQSMEAKGRAYEWEAQENRDMAQLDRLAKTQTNYQQQEVAAWSAQQQAISSGISAQANMFMQYGMSPQGASAQFSDSDRRLKKNIKLIGYSPSGLRIYAFEYINKLLGDGIFQGVMSDEIPQYAVIKGNDEYDKVNYSKIDVEFKRI